MMYAIYAGNKTAYNESWLRVGEYGKNTEVFDPVLTLEDNAAGSLTFTMPPDNQAYDTLQRMSTEVRVCEVIFNTTSKAKEETEIWRGRVLEEHTDFMNNRIITCEGELAYLKDTRQPQKRYSKETVGPKAFFKAILDIHNSKAGKKKSFTLRYCEFDDWENSEAKYITPSDYEATEEDLYRITSYEDTLSVIGTAFEDLKNPHINIEWKDGTRYLDILKEAEDGGTWCASVVPGQEVRLGVNLLDCAKNYDLSEIASAIIPLGAQKEGEKANLGKPLPMPLLYGAYIDGKTGVVHGPGSIDDDNFLMMGSYVVSENQKYFYTGRHVNGHGMWTFTSDVAGQKVIEFHASDEADPEDDDEMQNGKITDLIEEVITVPKGATRLFIAGWTDAVPLRLNEYLPDSEAEQYVTVKEVEDKTKGKEKQKGTVYVTNKELLTTYGWIEKVIEFPKITDPKLLYERTRTYFAEEMFENLILEVKVVDMSSLDKSASPFKIGYKVPVISKPHDLDTSFPITKLELHLGSPENSTVTLGKKKKRTITSITASSQAKILKTVTETATAQSSRIQEGIERASDLIKNGMNGYVSLVRDERDSNIIREIVISQEPDYKTTKNGVWRWNANGLGYSPTGYDDEKFKANVAITMNGEINATLVRTGTMEADHIRGGELKIGSDGVAGAALKIYALIPDGSGGYTTEKVGYVDERGLSINTYDTSDKEYKSVGVTDGSIRGYFKNDTTGSYTPSGTLNLAAPNDTTHANDVLLTAQDDNGQLVFRSGHNTVFRSGFDIQFRVSGKNSTIAFIDDNGIHLRGTNRGFFIEGSDWEHVGYTGSFSIPNGGTVHVHGGIIYSIT